MLYREASFRADTEIKLEAGAVVFWTDIVCPGRVLRGEVFQYDRYDSRLKVFYEEQLIYYNRQCVEPQQIDISLEVDETDFPKTSFRRLGGWEGYTHQGTFYTFSDQVKPEHLPPIQALLEQFPHLHGGVSLTYKHGLIVTVLGNSVWELQQFLDEAWILMKSFV
jgi:urease accessory protein